MWQAGLAQAVITPDQPFFLAGYGSRRLSAGRHHDLWAKALALQDAAGRRAVALTTDLMGVSKGTYETVVAECARRFGLAREQVLLTSSHNHCAPVTTDCLPDYYPLSPDEWRQVDAYTAWLEPRLVGVVGQALAELQPAELAAGEGRCSFAANRRNNREDEVLDRLAQGAALHGPVDHSVPLLRVTAPGGALRAVVFGYACHPTTLSDLDWCGDYPGFAQLAVEAAHPGAMALFWTGCGGDQNPLPRRSLERCAAYGQQLATSVELALAGELRPLAPALGTAFEFAELEFHQLATRAELERDAAANRSVNGRWAQRLLRELDAGVVQPTKVPYGVQAWRLGDQLWLSLGGEAVVDFAHRFRREYGDRTWVGGYAHDLVAYIPSARVWDEGGYEGEHIYEYGWQAYRWTRDTEERVAAVVARVVERSRAD